MTEQHLSDLRICRANFARLLKACSIEEINAVPDGFNNNIIWNFGHALVSQQLLCYKLSGLPMQVPTSLIDAYRNGSKPDLPVVQTGVDMLLGLAEESVAQLEADMERGVFKTFSSYATSYGITLNSFEDAMRFNVLHESLHLGYAMAMRRLT